MSILFTLTLFTVAITGNNNDTDRISQVCYPRENGTQNIIAKQHSLQDMLGVHKLYHASFEYSGTEMFQLSVGKIPMHINQNVDSDIIDELTKMEPTEWNSGSILVFVIWIITVFYVFANKYRTTDSADLEFGELFTTPFGNVKEILNPEWFITNQTLARSLHKFGACVSTFSHEELLKTEARMFVSENHSCFAAVTKSGEMIGCTKHPDIGSRNDMKAVVFVSIEEGGAIFLECLETILPQLYMKYGFEATCKTAWNDRFTPVDWDFQLYNKFNNGKPDYVYMVLQNNIDVMENLSKQWKPKYDPTAVPKLSDGGQCDKLQTRCVKKLWGHRISKIRPSTVLEKKVLTKKVLKKSITLTEKVLKKSITKIKEPKKQMLIMSQTCSENTEPSTFLTTRPSNRRPSTPSLCSMPTKSSKFLPKTRSATLPTRFSFKFAPSLSLLTDDAMTPCTPTLSGA